MKKLRFRVWDDIEKKYLDRGVGIKDAGAWGEENIIHEQSLGFNDVNGQEIYERDILVIKYDSEFDGEPYWYDREPLIVCWIPEYCGFYGMSHKNWMLYNLKVKDWKLQVSLGLRSDNGDGYRIIGNLLTNYDIVYGSIK